jgi:hypothetical protein
MSSDFGDELYRIVTESEPNGKETQENGKNSEMGRKELEF